LIILGHRVQRSVRLNGRIYDLRSIVLFPLIPYWQHPLVLYFWDVFGVLARQSILDAWLLPEKRLDLHQVLLIWNLPILAHLLILCFLHHHLVWLLLLQIGLINLKILLVGTILHMSLILHHVLGHPILRRVYLLHLHLLHLHPILLHPLTFHLYGRHHMLLRMLRLLILRWILKVLVFGSFVHLCQIDNKLE
jgi:hypothetical protein